jgi:hypothetical protein
MLGLFLYKRSLRRAAHPGFYSLFIARRPLLQTAKMTTETIPVLSDSELADGQMKARYTLSDPGFIDNSTGKR